MFTGIVQHVGRITAAEPTASGIRITVDPCGWAHAPARGDSIGVSGTCLTVVESVDGAWAFDAVPQTLGRTTLGALHTLPRAVNLEHAVLASTPMGGHIVQGHVDGVGRVAAIMTEGQWRVRIEPPAEAAPCIVAQGSITVDGVSLTVVSVDDDGFTVSLIPATLAHTTLGRLQVGDPVNLEVDAIAKYVERLLQARSDDSR